jgi:catechol 2,3-dioxygenase-like lactoylglutathione lyase family enzyme
MIGYTTLGTNDLDRATAFYDGLLGLLGARRAMSFPRGHLWSAGAGQPMFGVLTPYDGQPATVGNGTMIALTCPDRATVDALHGKLLELGGRDEGAPGERFPGFYAAYGRDLDGNKLAFIRMG